jgi:hypothetical protein
MEAVMSADDTPMSPTVVLKMPKATRDFITRVKVIIAALLGNKFFPNPTPSLDVLAEDIAALEEAETMAATRVMGATALRNARKKKVQDDLDQIRGYVQSVVAASTNPCDAVAMIEGAGMRVRKPMTRNTPAISAKNADVSGKVVLAAVGGVLVGVQPRPGEVDPHPQHVEGPDRGLGPSVGVHALLPVPRVNARGRAGLLAGREPARSLRRASRSAI